MERPADPGDLVIVDYTIEPEGRSRRTETGTASVERGPACCPRWRRRSIGLGAGDSRQDAGALPRRPPQRGAARQVGQARVTVTEVKEKVLPALDDEFAKTVGSAPSRRWRSCGPRSAPELVARARRGTIAARWRTAVLDAVMAGHDFEVPEALILREVAHRIEHAGSHAPAGGGSGKVAVGLQEARWRTCVPAPSRRCKRALLIEAIAEKEGLAAADADVEAEIERAGPGSQRPAPQPSGGCSSESGDLEGLRHSLGEAPDNRSARRNESGKDRRGTLEHGKEAPDGTGTRWSWSRPRAASGPTTSSPGCSRSGSSSSRRYIDDIMANLVIAQLLFLEAEDPDKDIYLYINSPGRVGDGRPGHLRHDAVRQAGDVDHLHGAGRVDGRAAARPPAPRASASRCRTRGS